MIPATLAARLAVIAYLCVLGSCSCSNGTVEGILGESVNLSCMSASCGSKQWRNDSMGDTSRFIKPAKHTSLQSDGDSFKLLIFNLSTYDVGSYSCWCNEINDSAYHICSDSLKLICQAKVVVNNASKLHNISRTDSFPEVIINANVKDRLKVKCPEGAVPKTNCYNVRKRASAQFTYSFKILPTHHTCRITCQSRKKARVDCRITFTINVSRKETSTHNSTVSPTVLIVSPVIETTFTTFSSENIDRVQADTTMEVDEQNNKSLDPVTNKPASFSAMIVVGILVFIVVVLIFVVGFFISSSRLKFSSQSSKIANPPHSSTDANIPIGPTYATVNKSPNGSEKGDDHSIERGAASIDGLYFEVGGSGKEESLTHQPKSQKAETSITNDYYSKVNTSEVKLKTMENLQETDSTMYTEVNKGENQPRQKECTSSPQRSSDDPSVSNVPIYHVLEESKRSEHDTVDDACTSQVLYAVVDKDT